MSRFQTRRDAKLRRLRELGPMVAASLCRRMVTCGNPRCKCAGGEKHESWCLTYKVKGRTRTVHVPMAMLEEVDKWVTEHKKAKTLLAQISDLSMAIIKRHVRARRAAERGKRSANRQ